MSELPSRVRRAFRDHGSFERIDDAAWTSTTTPFEGDVTVAAVDGDETRFDVTVRVPTLDAVTEGSVAAVVEEGWYETFELRVADVSGVTRAEREIDPLVYRDDDEIVVEASLADRNPSRGVDDAGALISFVEGTYVQGIIPGYEYTEPVRGILSRARQQGNSGA